MSDRPCNFCILQQMKKKHGEDKVEVRFDPQKRMMQVWVKGQPSGMWFGRVGDKCAC